MVGSEPSEGFGHERKFNILIVGLNFWPEETGNAPYTTGLAEYLAARGHQVTVITGMPHYPKWEVFEGYRGKLRIDEAHSGVRVRRLLHYVPRHHSALHRGILEATHLLNGITLSGVNRPDVVLGVMPSLSGGALAIAQAFRHKVPCGLIIQDLMGRGARQSGVPGGRGLAGLISAVEGAIIRKATGIVVVSDGFLPHLEDLSVAHRNVWHIKNWAHVNKPKLVRSDVRSRLGWSDNEYVVLHAGNMGFKQALENVINAAQIARNKVPSFRFVIMGNGNQRQHLETLAAGLPNVAFLDPQPKEIFPDVLAAADALLINERRGLLDMSLPSKLTSYFAAGRPVIAAVEKEGATAREIERSGGGFIVRPENPEDLLQGLLSLQAQPDFAEALVLNASQYLHTQLDSRVALPRYEAFIASLMEG